MRSWKKAMEKNKSWSPLTNQLTIRQKVMDPPMVGLKRLIDDSW